MSAIKNEDVGVESSRREFLKGSTLAAVGVGAGVLSATRTLPGAFAAGDDTIRIGLVGCGGRGTGAATQALSTSGGVKLVAMGDAFQDNLNTSFKSLEGKFADSGRVAITPDHLYVGFDAYKKVLATDVDLVILATPPHFRPAHFAAAIAAGKHCFIEKPVAVDGPGVRSVIKTSEEAKAKGLAVVCGLQRHHQNGYREAMQRIHDGAIGDIVAARAYWNMGSLWDKPRQPEWSDMEWQLRNWLYFTWLSGDHICEQHVHNLDVINWAKQKHPVRCFGMGGRQVRTAPAFGNIYDHHSVHFEYDDGSWMFSQCRQIPGCMNDVSEHLIGTIGKADLKDGGPAPWKILGKNAWTFDGVKNNPYQTEHDDLFASIRAGKPLNEGQFVAESTLTAIMGRMATYSGKEVTWDQAWNSTISLGPGKYEFGKLEVPPVAIPGITQV